MQNLTLVLERLSTYEIPPSGGTLSVEMSQKIRTIQNTLRQIQDSMSVPPASSNTLTETLEKLNTLRYNNTTHLKISFKRIDSNLTHFFQVSGEGSEG